MSAMSTERSSTRHGPATDDFTTWRESGSVFDDVASVTENYALDALAKRQRTIADNMSNVETPGFLAGRVSFEESLAHALRNGDLSQATMSTARSLEPTREDGNNVNMDHEFLSNVDTNLRYQTMLRAVDDKFGLLRTVIRGQ
jgi:flagellar basal-body rod protein FlgB